MEVDLTALLNANSDSFVNITAKQSLQHAHHTVEMELQLESKLQLDVMMEIRFKEQKMDAGQTVQLPHYGAVNCNQESLKVYAHLNVEMANLMPHMESNVMMEIITMVMVVLLHAKPSHHLHVLTLKMLFQAVPQLVVMVK